MNNSTKNTFSILSLVFGILSIITGCILLGGIFGIAGIVFYALSLKNSGQSKENIAGLITSIIGIVIATFVLIALVVSPKTDTPTEPSVSNSTSETAAGGTSEISDTEATSENIKESSPTANMEEVIRNRITDNYSNTDIDGISLNEDLGTDEEGDYVALVYLTWNVKNSGKMSKEMLSMYSGDLAATVAHDCPDIQEIAIFWTVPHLNDANAKCSYERKGNEMYEMDMWWPSVFEE